MMKKIYTFTLDDEIPLSDIVKSDVKLIAYFLYEKINDMDYDGDNPILVINNLLKVNYLYEKKICNDYIYCFESERMNNDSRMFNPMLIDDFTFGITIYDGKIDEDKICELLRETMMMLKLRYKFKISSALYYSKDKYDEANRLTVFDSSDKDDIENKKYVKSKKMMSLNMIMKLLGG